MLKSQITLITILIGCIAFVGCERAQDTLDNVIIEPEAAMMPDPAVYMLWENVNLPAPSMTVDEAAAAMNPAGTGQAHGKGTRTAYLNEAAAMANKEMTDYPNGSMIVKEIMNEMNTFVWGVAVMTKTDDPMYAVHDGWIYAKWIRQGTEDDWTLAGGGTLEMSGGCYSCHAKAENDSVFVSLAMGSDGSTDDGSTDDGSTNDGSTDDTGTDTTNDGDADDTTDGDGTS